MNPLVGAIRKILTEYNCMIPEHKVMTAPYKPEMKRNIQSHHFVINPIPEFVLSSFLVCSIGLDGGMNMTMVIYYEEDRNRGDAFGKFFQDRR